MGNISDWGTTACDATFYIYGCSDTVFMQACCYITIALSVISSKFFFLLSKEREMIDNHPV